MRREMFEMDRVMRRMSKAVKQCGRMILKADRSGMQIDSKSGCANFVTEYDKKVQDMLRCKLAKILPDALFIGEEGETETYSDKGRFFIVDPIDGTTNFIKDYRVSCISVALVEDGRVTIAFVYNPYMDELFWAKRGEGAYCNGRRLKVSEQSLDNGIVIFGTSPYDATLSEMSFKKAYEYFKQSLDIRRSGSAALDLCSIAAGRAELFFEMILQPWDYAAGVLLVEEAGGKVTTVEGDEVSLDKGCSILARGSGVLV